VSLPDNVTAETVYTVSPEDYAKIAVKSDDLNGVLWVQQSGTTVTVPTHAVPGLIAALTAAAGLDAPAAPTLPAYVIDGLGNRHELAPDGTYRLCFPGGGRGLIRRTLEYIRAELGIREEG
jgi:hypothetical protein